jgi:NADH-ubiquinone oxidoreductase chain 6
MHILFVSDNFSFGYLISYTYIFTTLSIILGIFIIITKNPIISVLYLILLFSSISCYLILIGITFIGISYLLVYVGAVSILFIFILMLINIRVSELISDTNNNIPLAILTIIAFFVPLSNLFPEPKTNHSVTEFNKLLEDTIDTEQVSYVTSKD